MNNNLFLCIYLLLLKMFCSYSNEKSHKNGTYNGNYWCPLKFEIIFPQLYYC